VAVSLAGEFVALGKPPLRQREEPASLCDGAGSDGKNSLKKFNQMI